MIWRFVLLSLVTLTPLSHCSTFTDDSCDSKNIKNLDADTNLWNDLILCYKNYDRLVRNDTKPVLVSLWVAIKYITFDDTNSLINARSWLAVTWHDKYLTWKASDYGEIQTYIIPAYRIWTPQIIMANSVNSNGGGKLITFNSPCKVQSTGDVKCVEPASYIAQCRSDADVSTWPYDKISCTLEFSVFDPYAINLTGEQVSFYNLFENRGWELLSANMSESLVKATAAQSGGRGRRGLIKQINVTLLLQRRSASHAALIVVPAVALSLLTLSITRDRGRASFVIGAGCLLAHMFALSRLAGIAHVNSSDKPSSIVLFYRNSMGLCWAVLLFKPFLRLLERRNTDLPRWVESIIWLTSCGKKTNGNIDNTEEKCSKHRRWCTLAVRISNVWFLIIIVTYIYLYIIFIIPF